MTSTLGSSPQCPMGLSTESATGISACVASEGRGCARRGRGSISESVEGPAYLVDAAGAHGCRHLFPALDRLEQLARLLDALAHRRELALGRRGLLARTRRRRALFFQGVGGLDLRVRVRRAKGGRLLGVLAPGPRELGLDVD